MRLIFSSQASVKCVQFATIVALHLDIVKSRIYDSWAYTLKYSNNNSVIRQKAGGSEGTVGEIASIFHQRLQINLINTIKLVLYYVFILFTGDEHRWE